MAVSRFLRDALFAVGPKTAMNPEMINIRIISNCGVQVDKALLRASAEWILSTVENILMYDINRQVKHT